MSPEHGHSSNQASANCNQKLPGSLPPHITSTGFSNQQQMNPNSDCLFAELAMQSSDYSSTGGGALKLKGSKPVGVEKKRKKKKPSTTTASGEKSSLSKNTPNNPDSEDENDDCKDKDVVEEDLDVVKNEDSSKSRPVNKTKAEREQEERRRKRVSIHVD